MIEFKENMISNFEGTIIDIETTGEFNKLCRYDSRLYKDLKQVILGYVNESHIHIYCAESPNEITELQETTRRLVEKLSRPLYAYNCHFETGVWFHHCGIQISFDGELQTQRYERKKDVVRILEIPNYEDPFLDNGYLCMKAWEKGDLHKAVAHNRACLLKERDILLSRGSRNPDTLAFVRG